MKKIIYIVSDGQHSNKQKRKIRCLFNKQLPYFNIDVWIWLECLSPVWYTRVYCMFFSSIYSPSNVKHMSRIPSTTVTNLLSTDAKKWKMKNRIWCLMSLTRAHTHIVFLSANQILVTKKSFLWLNFPCFNGGKSSVYIRLVESLENLFRFFIFSHWKWKKKKFSMKSYKKRNWGIHWTWNYI